eukprot:scaffold3644_cov58-Attheya_sp.AAC.7
MSSSSSDPAVYPSLQQSRSLSSPTTSSQQQQQQQQQQQPHTLSGGSFSSSFQEDIVEPSRRALHHFFYPTNHTPTNEDTNNNGNHNLFDANFEDSFSTATPATTSVSPVMTVPQQRLVRNSHDSHARNAGLGVTPAERYSQEERKMVENVWKAYDAIVILNEPWEHANQSEEPASSEGLRRRRPHTHVPLPFMPAGHFFRTRTEGQDELREVQLAALERRIRASTSLVLFPAPKEQDDVLEHYSHAEEEEHQHDTLAHNHHDHPAPNHHSSQLQLFEIGSDDDDDDEDKQDSSSSVISAGTQPMTLTEAGCNSYEESTIPAADIDTKRATVRHRSTASSTTPRPVATASPTSNSTTTTTTTRPTGLSPPSTAATTTAATSGNQNHIQMLNDVSANLNTLSRVNIADGWDVGTTPEAMSDDLLLGLRVGFW